MPAPQPADRAPHAAPVPYLTRAVPPLPGRVKERWEDFRVDELPATLPSGEGAHLWVRIEKRGLTTAQAAGRVARLCGVRASAVGAAGRKDARAVATQWLSVEGGDPERVLGFESPRLLVLEARRHGRKLRTGHLAGNRFDLRLRGVDPRRLDDARRVLAELERRGVPNAFGVQRFGNRGDTWRVGRALLAGRADEAARAIAGDPGPSDRGAVLRARELFAAGRYAEAARAWPGGYGESARLCHALARTAGDAERALALLPKASLRFYVSAFQAHLFNRILARRAEAVDRLLSGDWAQVRATGGVFPVADAGAEAARCERFEISPTAPLYGRHVGVSEGEAGRVEREALGEAGVEPEAFARGGRLSSKGSRRALRFRPEALSLEPVEPPEPLEPTRTVEGGDGPAWRLRFELPPGSYATCLVGELLK